MSYRSSAGWFWPDFDAIPVEPARPPAAVPAGGSATPPPVARVDRWAQPAPPTARPGRRPGEAPAAPAAAPPRLTPAGG
jgi:tellurite resistance protein TerA